MTIKTCIKFSLFWLFLFAQSYADTTIVPYDANKDNILESDRHAAQIPQTTFTDLIFVLLKTLFVIMALIAFLYFAVYLFRRLTEQRFTNRTQGENIKILERAILSNKSAIYLVEVKNKYFLIGESHNGLSDLGSITNE